MRGYTRALSRVQSEESGIGGRQAGKVGKVDIELRATHWLLLFGTVCLVMFWGDVLIKVGRLV